MKYLRKNTDLLVIFSFALISLFVVSLWYKGVDFLGGGEEGLSLWRPEKALLTSKNVWLDVGLGYPTPFFLPRVPLYAVASLLNKIVNSKVVQELFFVANIVVAFSGVYFFVKNFVKKNTSLAIFSGIFYIFNLYTQSQVFARFVYTGIVAWAFIPFFLYLFAKWIEGGRSKYLVIFLLANLLASHAYSHPSYILIIWFILGFWYLIFILKSQDKLILTKRFLGVLILWILTNIWWMYPMLKLAGSAAGNPSIRGWEYDFATLRGLSRDFTNFDVLLLRQKYYFEKSGYWGEFYKNTFVYVLSISGFLFMLIGMFKKKYIKNKVFFVFLLFIGWFLSKGVNFPFGTIFYKNMFRLLPILGIFRNSYEKLGVIFLLPYPIFFAVGVSRIANSLKGKSKVVFYTFVIFFITGLLVWPMWTGSVFSDLAKVSVPEYYQEANEFLNKSDTDLRVLALPFVPGEGVNYTWERGEYYGLEPGEFLFDRSFVNWIIPNSYAGDKSKEIIDFLAQGQLPDVLLTELGVGYVVFHKDMNTSYSGAESLEKTAILLKGQNSLEYLRNFGDLEIFSVNGADEGIVSIENDCEHELSLEYEKLNSRKYKIHLKNAQCQFNLILKTTYNDFWQVKVDEGVLTDHYLAYGYANGWHVNRQGDYEIDIIFKIWPWE